MKQIVIGLGEVGSALRKVLECDGYDSVSPLSELGEGYDVMHIAFPYTPGRFAEMVKRYKERTGASLVIVHSTVPVGTCDPLHAVHSPIRGVHPNLEQGIRTFVKFFGGPEAQIAAGIFAERGIKVMTTPLAASTEALKLWDTAQYGWNILIEKAIHSYCEERGLDYAMIYTLANATYNRGYELLGRYDVQRPVLRHVEGPIGGHCVKENWEMLEDPIAVLSKDLHKRIIETEKGV